MKRPVEDGVSMLIGAGVGMALMYLLDPNEGSSRRAQIQQAARDRLAKASDAASAGFDYLHETVDRAAQSPALHNLAAHAADAAKAAYSDIGAKATAAAHEYQQQASDAAQALHGQLSDKLSNKLNQLRGKASDLKDGEKWNYGSWLNKSTIALGRDEDHHYIGQTACALGSLALGAGAVYLFDPEQGYRRRSHLIGGTVHAVRETGDFFRKAGRRMVTSGGVVARRVADRAHEAVWHWQPSDPATDAPSDAGQSDQAQVNDSASPSDRASTPAAEANQASMGT